MGTDQKIKLLREWMDSNGVDAVVVPTGDPHRSEYVSEYWQGRKWLTGFSGSAGTAVVTKDKAILWTDFRYYIQAERQIAGSKFELFKMGEPDVPTYRKWLTQNLSTGQVVGVDAEMFSRNEIRTLNKKFDKSGIKINTLANPFEDLWADRPERPDSKAYSFSVEYAGKSRTEKIEQIRQKMLEYNATGHLVSTLDDIAWTLNLRGNDVHTNPVNIAYLLIFRNKTTLFIPETKIDEALKEELSSDGVEVAAYESVFDALSRLDETQTLLMDPDCVNYRLFSAINPKCRIVEKVNPAIEMKALKNDVEIGHIRRTAVKDGVALVNFFHWLEQTDEASDISEITVAENLKAFRKEQELFVDNSFDPIMAFEDHSAMCHYSATKETDVPITQDGMFLTDSGGNYLTGTTDVTRAVYRGKPQRQHVVDYTLVLKGHISVATAIFPKGTKGFQIDTLARQFLWQEGMNFGHGTGHGVGFFLCVHEGPARISPVQSEVALEKGMFLTNEPGVYREGQYGIRLENQILVEDAFENEFGRFFKFENVTFCHFEKELIDKNMLSQKEIDWLNDYHTQVYEKLSPYLKQEVAAWLKTKTAPI